jgi:glucose-1-phosphate cytidylyltransferase
VQAVILAGGLGTRLREETEFRPKPMVEIGGYPIIWHLMKNLSCHNISEFILCLGYKGEIIRNYFRNYRSNVNDITISLQNNNTSEVNENYRGEPWTITMVNTGELTMTGGRIYKVRDYIKEDFFLCTYGDGLSNVEIDELVNFHKSHGKIATVTAVKPITRFGILEVADRGQVKSFAEKPVSKDLINGGFFIFSRKIFNYLDDQCVLEAEPLQRLTSEGNLMAYTHNGYWQPMDTYREASDLNALWNSGLAPWKNW